MKKLTTKLLSSAMVLALVLSLLPMVVFAENTAFDVAFEGIHTTINEEALGEGKFATGVDYTFTLTPDDGYTLAYYCIWGLDEKGYVYTILGEEAEPSQTTFTVNRNDTDGIDTVKIIAISADSKVERDDYSAVANEITSASYSDTFTPINESYIDIYDENNALRGAYFGKLYKTNLEKDSILKVSAKAPESYDQNMDTVLSLHAYNSENELVKSIYVDKTGGGESLNYLAEEAVTVYICAFHFLRGDAMKEIEFSLTSAPVSENDYVSLTFVGKNVMLDSDITGEKRYLKYSQNIIGEYTVVDGYTLYDIYGICTTEEGSYSFPLYYENGEFEISYNELKGDITLYAIAYNTPRSMTDDAYALKIDSFPYSDTFRPLEQELYIFEDYDNENPADDVLVLGKLYKLDVENDDEITFSLTGPNEADTRMKYFVFDENGASVSEGYVDNDTVNEFGEKTVYTSDHNGTIYIFATCYEEDLSKELTFTLEKETFEEVGSALDFVNNPSSASGEKWAYDANTKTLTLSDGFNVTLRETAITLPENSTINVKGNVNVYSKSSAIKYVGGLTVNVDDNSTFTVESSSACALETKTSKAALNLNGKNNKTSKLVVSGFDTILNYGDININKLSVDVKAEEDGIKAYEGAITIKDSSIYAVSVSDSIIIDGNIATGSHDITITNSMLSLVSSDEVIQNYLGSVTIKDSDCLLLTDDEEGIDAEEGIISIEGGRIIADTQEDVFEAKGDIIIKDVTLNIKTDASYSLFKLNSQEAKLIFSGGKVCLGTDSIGTAYIGQWKDEFYNAVDGSVSVTDGNTTTLMTSLITITELDNATLDSLKDSYAPGEMVDFTVDNIKYPTLLNTQFFLENFTITDASGQVVFNGNKDTDTSKLTSILKEGSYTISATFKKYLFNNASWILVPDASGVAETKIVTKNFTVKVPATPTPAPTPTPTPGATGGTSSGGQADDKPTGDVSQIVTISILALSVILVSSTLVIRKKED